MSLRFRPLHAQVPLELVAEDEDRCGVPVVGRLAFAGWQSRGLRVAWAEPSTSNGCPGVGDLG